MKNYLTAKRFKPKAIIATVYRRKQDLWIGLAVALTILLYRLPKFLEKNFGELSVEQLFFHLTTEVGGTPSDFIWSLSKYLVLKPLLWAGLFVLLLGYLKGWRRRFLVGLSLPACMIAVSVASLHLYRVLNLGDYWNPPPDAVSAHDVNWMSDWYVAPKVTKARSGRDLNLIYIYVESLEGTRVAPYSLLRGNSAKTFVADSFMVLPGTQWTLAGMVATQCGVPLLPVGLHGGNRFDKMVEPLKNAECLGDILQKNGYVGEFIGGANEAFSGKDKFLFGHGYRMIWGREELDAIYSPNGYPSEWWGHSDHTVLDFARKRVTELAKLPTPYFLSVLTLDTHGPNGLLTPYCQSRGYLDTPESIFSCSMAQVEEFIFWLKEQEHLKDTVVVVSGDHPFMSPQNASSLRHSKQQALASRDVFFSITAPHALPKTGATMNHFDALPTILATLGFEVERNQAALGRNLLAADSLSKQASQNALAVSLRKKSEGYIDLWQ